MCFQIAAEALIVSSGDGLYMFCLKTFQKIESFQCSSSFGIYMSFKDLSELNEREVVGEDSFRIAYQNPENPG